MVIESGKHGVTREVMAIVAGLSIQDPRERPLEKRPQADTAHARFTDPTSDFLTLLNLWNYLKTKEKELSGNQFRRMCQAEYLNFLRIREWMDVYRQLKRMAKPLGLTVGDASADPARPSTARCWPACSARSASKISRKDSQDRSRATTSAPGRSGSRIFPGSALAKKQPNEIMTAELVETSRLFARMNAAIDLGLGGAARRRPRQTQLRRTALGEEPGLGRRLRAGHPVRGADRGKTGGCSTRGSTRATRASCSSATRWSTAIGISSRIDQRLSAFDRANRALRKQLVELEERTRRRDILFDDEAVFEFYDRRIPADVTTQRGFERWWKQARAETPDWLTMTPGEPASTSDSDAPVRTSGPDGRLTRRSGSRTTSSCSCSYRFEPGAEDDGVTRAGSARAARPDEAEPVSTGRCPGSARNWSPR